MSTPRTSPLFEGEKGSPSPCLGALLDPSCQETIPSACSDKLIPENVFFFSLSPLPFPPSCYNVFSIFNPRPSKLPSSLQTRSDEWSLKNQNLNAWLLGFNLFVIINPAPTLARWTKLCIYIFLLVWSVFFFFWKVADSISCLNHDQMFPIGGRQTAFAQEFISPMSCK